MVTPVKVKVRVITDNSGFECWLPVLVTEHGVLKPLLDYLLTHRHDRSVSWMTKVTHSTYLLMQYMEANKHCFHDPVQLFQSFTLALYEGTIGDNGLDPSNLYWLPSRNKTTNGVINAISGLTDWLSENHNVNNMNPLREADSFEKRLNYAAWFRRSHNDFLGHIKDRSISDTVNKVRSISGRQLMATSSDAIAFSEPLFGRFFLEGIGGASDRRVIVRNQLIILMMHFTGCRISDSLHLWVQDVHYDHNDEKKANVRLYHPEDGLAPDGWKSSKGSTNRAAYLREKYALTSRNRITGTQHVGWKNRISDHKDFFIQLHWFPSDVGRLFLKLWNEYLYYLADIKRRHPYAFISFERNFYGDPLTINAFTDAYNKALARIGESPCCG